MRSNTEKLYDKKKIMNACGVTAFTVCHVRDTINGSQVHPATQLLSDDVN